MELRKSLENETRQKYRNFGLRNMEKDMKVGKYNGKIKNLMKPGDKNKNEMIKTKVEYDGKEGDETGEPQRQKCGKSVPNIDTNDMICCNSSTSATRKINNDKNKNNKNNRKDRETASNTKHTRNQKRKQKERIVQYTPQ